jgi:adenylate cyclase
MERRLAAILAADVAGYSHLTELNEEASTATLRMYGAVVEGSIVAHRGHIFSSAGDGFVAEFPSVVEAIRCAVEIQNEIAERNAAAPEDGRMQYRIGVNLGDVVAEENNLYGTGVNVAARLEELAEPGEIYISQSVHDQVWKIVDIPFEDIGEHRLKNISEPVHVYRILPSPLPWVKRLFSRTNIRRRRLGVAAGVALLLLAVAGAFYPDKPAALWATLLGDAGGLSLPEHPAIAVLPFDDMSATHDQEYLADGIAEELSTGLAKFPELIVLGRSSTRKYENTPTDLRQVGKDLNVRYVVKGSVQRSSDTNVLVTAHLIDASTAQLLWGQTYDQQATGIFAIRDDIMRSIAGTIGGLQGKVAKAEIERISGKDPNSFTAYDYVMRGWHEFYKVVDNPTPEGNAAARNLFELATKIDPNYARAYAGLAWTYSLDCDYDWTDDFDKTLKLVLENASTAVRLDPNDYQAHWALGWAYLYNGEYEKAEASYKRARQLNPNDAEVLAEMSNFLVYVGQPEQAIDQLKEAMRLNPFQPYSYVRYLGWAYEEAGMPKEAIAILKPEIDVKNPDDDQLWFFPTLAAAYANPIVGRMDDAHRIVRTLLSHKPAFSISKNVAELPYKTDEQRDRYVNALRRAGLPDEAVGKQSARPGAQFTLIEGTEACPLWVKQTSRHVRVLSVIPLKADIHQRGLHVPLVP